MAIKYIDFYIDYKYTNSQRFGILQNKTLFFFYSEAFIIISDIYQNHSESQCKKATNLRKLYRRRTFTKGVFLTIIHISCSCLLVFINTYGKFI